MINPACKKGQTTLFTTLGSVGGIAMLSIIEIANLNVERYY
jgi:hypothetical protein